ncbi:MAG: energy transducer TonB [Bryobacteraceae bacterium]
MTSFTVRLSPELLARVSQLVETIGLSDIESGTEIRGALFGARQADLVIANIFRVVPFHDSRPARHEHYEKALERLLAVFKADPELTSLELVGSCRICSAQRKELLENDVIFHSRCFQPACNVALMLTPDEQGGVSVELYARWPNNISVRGRYCWGAGSLFRETPFTDPIDIQMHAEEDLLDVDGLPCRALEPADRAGKMPPQIEAPRESPSLAPVSQLSRERLLSTISSLPQKHLRWVAVALCLAIAASAMFFGLQHAKSSTGAVNTSRVIGSVAPGSELGMKVEAQPGDRLLVTWNRENQIVKSAKYAILYIDDGPQHRELDFAPEEITGGSVLYRPASDDVKFHLQILERDDSLVDQTVRVLDGSMAVAMNAKAVTPQTNLDLTPSMSSPEAEHRTSPKTGSADKKPPSADKKPIGSAAEVADKKILPEGASQGAGHTLSKRALSITPPQLPVTTPPVAASMLNALPPAPPAPVISEKSSASSAARSQMGGPLEKRAKPLKRFVPNIKLLSPADLKGVRQVEVDVTIDEAGHVTGARLGDAANNVTTALGDSVTRAAKRWIFAPAMIQGKPVPSEHKILFQFQPQVR